MQSDEKHRDAAPARGWKSTRGHDETHAFIVRVHLSIAADGGARHPQFSLEDVGAGSTQRFATSAHALERLGSRINEIVSGPLDGQGQP